MGLFQENNNDELALLRAEIDRLKSQVGEQKQTKSAEAERIGVHSSDAPKGFAEWQAYRRKVGTHQYYSKKVQDKIQSDFAALGAERFWGSD